MAASSAKWDDRSHLIFVELCVEEVSKWNRPNTTLSPLGWQNVAVGFKRKAKIDYTIKQLKNHWDAMKGEHQLFKQLRRGYTGLGWDESSKSIAAPGGWWDQRIEENPKFKKFRGKDLSLYWFAYDELFSDIVASGEYARAPTQRDVDVDLAMADDEDEGLPGGEEGSGDSDDINHPTQFNLFPSSSLGKSKTSGSKKRKSGAEYVRDSLDNVVRAISYKTTATSGAQAAVDAKFEEAIGVLDNMECLEGMSDLYHFAQTFIIDREHRTLFLKSRNDEYRLSLLKYYYDKLNRG